jgi:hypothetical protein
MERLMPFEGIVLLTEASARQSAGISERQDS